MTNYVIDMAEIATVTTMTVNETRNLLALPFQPTEYQLTTDKKWGNGVMILRENLGGLDTQYLGPTETHRE